MNNTDFTWQLLQLHRVASLHIISLGDYIYIYGVMLLGWALIGIGGVAFELLSAEGVWLQARRLVLHTVGRFTIHSRFTNVVVYWP